MKTNSKYIYIALLTMVLGFFTNTIILAQNSSPYNKNIIPPSPQSYQFQKYIDYPVSYTTGVPQISIPIYEINTKGIKIPITLSYHASGYKRDEQSGLIGMGWTLNSGGFLNRSIINKADEWANYPNPYKDPHYLIQSNQADFNYVGDMASIQGYEFGGTDGEYDIFNYSLGDVSGKFIFKSKGDNQRVPITIPSEPIKITTDCSFDTHTPINYIDIKNSNGVLYKFGISTFDDNKEIEIQDQNIGSPTAWFLREITTPDGSETIKFYYDSYYISYGKRIQNFALKVKTLPNILELRSDNSCNGGMQGCYCTSPSGASNYLTEFNESRSPSYFTRKLTKIVFSQGTIELIYTSMNASTQILSQVIVKNNNGDTVKDIHLNQAYYQNIKSGDDLYKLSSIYSLDLNGNRFDEYKFDYEEAVDVGLYGIKNSKGFDYWDYYNGKNNNATLIPPFTYNNPDGAMLSNTSENDKNVNINAAKIFSLKKITYPTGGSAEYEYESNVANNNNVGGLRIRRIIGKDNLGNEYVKVYKYGKDENGNGILLQEPTVNAYTTVSEYSYKCPECCDQKLYWVFKKIAVSSEMFSNGNLNFGCPVFYDQVTESVYNPVNNSYNGKTIYKYEPPLKHQYYIGASLYNTLYDEWKTNHLIAKIEFKCTNSVYDTISKTEFLYSIRNDGNLKCSKVFIKQEGQFSPLPSYLWSDVAGGGTFSNSYTPINYYLKDGLNITNYGGIYYNVAEYEYSTGAKHLIQKKTTSYYSSGNVVEIENYTYGTDHNEPLSVSYIKSNGDIYKIKYRYPQDFIASQPYTYMVNNLNVINPVIEQLNYKINTDNTETFISSTKTNYNFWNNNNWSSTPTSMVVPQVIETKISDENAISITRVQFNKYDAHGNILEQQKPFDVKESYLWGYRYLYPIAKIVNASYAQVSAALSGITAEQLANSATPDITKLEGLRQHPDLSNSQITTYTYKPLVGMTSITDPRGVTTTFNYDTANRLGESRDRAGNILAEYQYAYATQTNSGSSMPVFPSITANMNCNTSVKTGVSESIAVSVGGGTGSFVYSWKITGANNAVLVNMEDTNMPSYAYTYLNDGSYTISCTVKDIVSGSTQTLSKTVVSSSITASMSVYTSNTINTSNYASVGASSGSNSFTYSYEVKNSSGTIVSSSYNTSSSSYVFYINTAGAYTVYCTVKDNVTGGTKTVSYDLYICNSAMSVTITGSSSFMRNSTGSLTANITGGSGSFTYLWTKSNNNISLNTYSVPLLYFTSGTTTGSTVLTFQVTDIKTGKTATATKTISIQ